MLGTRALAIGCGLTLLAALAAWFAAAPLVPGYYLGPVVAALGAALLLSLFRYPSALEAARVADRRLGLRERIATAVELARAGSGGPIARRQLATAVEAADWARQHWVAGPRSGRAAALALTLVLLTVGVVLLSSLEDRLAAPIPRPSIWGASPAQDPSSDQSAPAGIADEPDQRASVGRPMDGDSSGQTGAVDRALEDTRRARESGAIGSREAADRLARAESELSRQTQATQARREGLDRLGRALDQVAVGRPAAEQIQRGDYAAAGREIGELGTESDQLSPEGKQQLAQALRSAAADSQAQPELAAKERRAADALTSRDYEAAERALQDLGQDVARRGQDVVPRQDLTRAWEQVNAERRAQGQPESTEQARQPARPQEAGQAQGQRSPQPPGPQAGQSRAAPSSQGGQQGSGVGAEAGGEGGNEVGGQGAAGSGDGGGEATAQTRGAAPSAASVGEFRAGEPARRLDVQGRPVQVDVRPSHQNGRRDGEADADENEEPTDEVGAISTVSGEAPRPITSAAPSESNFVPSDRQEVVRGYFGPRSGR